MAKRGPKPPEIDVEEVEKLASRGLTQEQICYSLGFSPSSFYKYKALNTEIAEAVKRGKSKGVTVMANALFEQGKNGNTASAIFWLKNNAGWRDKMDITGEDGGPLRAVISSEPLSIEQWEKQNKG